MPPGRQKVVAGIAGLARRPKASENVGALARSEEGEGEAMEEREGEEAAAGQERAAIGGIFASASGTGDGDGDGCCL